MLAPLTFALTSAPVVVWRILTFRPDSVLCVEPTLLASPIALIAAKLVRARLILHVQDLEIDAAFAVGHLQGGILKNLALGVECKLLNLFDAVITISNRMCDRLAEKGVSREKLSVVRNWVNLENICSASGPSTYRRELGLHDDAFVALYAGNIGLKQGLPIVLNAAERLVDASKLIFVIAGEGPEKDGLMVRFGHLPNIRFLPLQPEERLGELLNFADVHLLPQEREAADLVLPSKLGGMLQSGKPCIVMAEAGTELYEFLDGSSIVIPPGDSAALAKALESIAAGTARFDLSRSKALAAHFDARQNLPAFAGILSTATSPHRQ